MRYSTKNFHSHKTDPPKRIELNTQEVDGLRKRLAARSLEEADYLIIEGMIETILFLSQALEEKSLSIKRLLQRIFGIRTESSKNVLGTSRADKENSSSKTQEPSDTTSDVHDTKRKGHGRNGANTYSGAERTFVSHPTLQSGDPCPLCFKGKVYRIKRPKVVVRIVGRAPLQAKVWELESLRCNLCGEVFSAQAPREVGEEKYDETCGAIICLLKYGSGFPFYRLEGLQKALGIPLPASTQWEIVEGVADKIYPAYEELIRQAAQGEILHNDDTVMRVLALANSTPDQQGRDKKDSSRKGVFTTGILSIKGEQKIALFFTGQKHAGENLNDLLEKRRPDLPLPIQMCDALSRNLPGNFLTILANCLSHARRNFTDVISCFPDECRYVIEILAQVYRHDEIAKEENMSPDERLKFHQEKSGPLMEELKKWLQDQIEGKKVEPNSSLGEAISYMLKHWDKLTLFLRVPGAPLDNNIVEQALKRAILHRKNSLFYKTQHGAYIGDCHMSLIYTCYLNKVNPFDYLVALQKYSHYVFKNPHLWMPWNYQSTMRRLHLHDPTDSEN